MRANHLSRRAGMVFEEALCFLGRRGGSREVGGRGYDRERKSRGGNDGWKSFKRRGEALEEWVDVYIFPDWGRIGQSALAWYSLTHLAHVSII